MKYLEFVVLVVLVAAILAIAIVVVHRAMSGPQTVPILIQEPVEVVPEPVHLFIHPPERP